jgi:hypothetical protein
MKQTYKSLLDTIYNSIKGNDKEWLKKQESSSVPFNRHDNKKDIEHKSLYYTVKIEDPKMQYKFNLGIYRYKSFWGYKYAAIINVSENKQWDSSVEKIGIDSSDGYQTELKKIFDTLKEIDDKKFKEAEEEKVNKYVRDVTLSIDKSILRDDKITDILKD